MKERQKSNSTKLSSSLYSTVNYHNIDLRTKFSAKAKKAKNVSLKS